MRLTLPMCLSLYLWSLSAVPDVAQGGTIQQPAMHQPRVDLYGDPLPEGAAARLGSVRFHHDDRITAMAFSPDGKALVVGCKEKKGISLRLWETATGKELSRFYVDNYGFDNCLSFTPNGKGVLVYTATPQLYDCASGKLLRSFQGVGHAYACDVSPDGRMLATQVYVGPDHLIHVWDLATGKEIRRLSGQISSPLDLKFSSDSKRLFSASESGGICIWEIATGKMAHQEMLRPMVKDRTRVALARNGRTAAIAKDVGDPGVVVLDVETGKKLCQIIADPGQLAFTPESNRLITQGSYASPILWDVATGKMVRQLPHCRDHRLAGLSSDGKLLATINAGFFHSSIMLWDIESGQPIHHGGGHWGIVTAVAFAPNGKLVASGGEDATIRLWNPDTGKELSTLKGHKDCILAVAFAPDGKLLASTAEDGTTRLWEVPGGRLLAKLDSPENGGPTFGRRLCGRSILRFSLDGKTLTVGGVDGGVQVWDLASARLSRSFTLDPQDTVVALGRDTILTVCPVSFFNVNRGGSHGNLSLWNATRGKHIRQLATGDGRACWAAAITADNRMVVAASSTVHSDGRGGIRASDHTIRLWEHSTAQEILTIKGPRINSLAFSGDSRILAAGHGNNSSWFDHEPGRDITLWNSFTSEKLHTLVGHTDEIVCLAFAPDGNRLASGSADHTVLIWDNLPDPQGKAPRAKVTNDQIEAWWKDLECDAAVAFRAISCLLQHPTQAVLLLGDKLKPAAAADTKRIEQFIKVLDSERYADRQEATKALEALGDLAELALRKSLASSPSLEHRKRVELLLDKIELAPVTAANLRLQRSLDILEWINNHESLQLLASLAKGAPEARQTRLAKEVIDRLAKK